MKPLSWFLLGVGFSVASAGVLALLFTQSANGFSAREKPSAVEEWMARRARSQAMPREAKERTNPVSSNDKVIGEGLAHWADHCASCHANDGSGETAMGKGMYPPVPDMRLEATQQMSDGELFYVIENGIRLTGMPAWGVTHDDAAIWDIVAFLRKLPELSADEYRAMAGAGTDHQAAQRR